MYVRKVVRENIHNIPIGTYIHSFSFHDKKDETTRVEMWKSESCIVWRTEDGKMHILDEMECSKLDFSINVISLNGSCEYLEEGQEYWKVLVSETICKYHKLEFDGKKHHPAKMYKPYRDIVYSHTNTSIPAGMQRFKSEEDAINFIKKVKAYYEIK